MRAGLKADIDGRARRRATGLCERHRLGMRASAGLGPAAPDNNAVADDDAADRRIAAGPPLAAFGKRDRGGQPAPVVGPERYFAAPTRAAIWASVLARRAASSFCASASSFSTSMPTTLPSAL